MCFIYCPNLFTLRVLLSVVKLLSSERSVENVRYVMSLVDFVMCTLALYWHGLIRPVFQIRVAVSEDTTPDSVGANGRKITYIHVLYCGWKEG